MKRQDHFNEGAQGSLFDVAPYTKPEPRMDYDPEAWIGRPDISFHASSKSQMPEEKNVEGARPSQRTGYGYGFHHGELAPAMARGRVTSPSRIDPDDFHSYNKREFVHPLRMSGSMALRPKPNTPAPYKPYPEDSPESISKNESYVAAQRKRPLAFTDSEANRHIEDEEEFRRSGSLKGKPERFVGEVPLREGLHVPYVNAAEATGSMSYRSPREHLHTWAEDVQSDPGASRHHQLLAEQFDLTIPAVENFAGQKNGPSGPLRRSSIVIGHKLEKKPPADDPTAPHARIPGAEFVMGHQASARNLPESLSGEVSYQSSLLEGPPNTGRAAPSGQSELHVLRPRMKKKAVEE